jgi:hypothetical protein
VLSGHQRRPVAGLDCGNAFGNEVVEFVGG